MKKRIRHIIRSAVCTFTIIAMVASNGMIALAQTTFKPGTSTGITNTFSGTQFTSVGGAVAGCANIGGGISSVAKSLFGKSVPTPRNTVGGANDAGDTFNDDADVGLGDACVTDPSLCADQGAGGAPAPESEPHTNDIDSDAIPLSESQSANAVPVSDLRTQRAAIATQDNLEKLTKIEQCLNGVAYTAAKFVLQQVQSKTINWINTGLSGGPLYVQNLPSFLKGVQDREIGKFLSVVRNDNPIFGDFLQTAVTQQVTGRTDAFIDKFAGTKSYPYEYAGRRCPTDYAARASADYATCIQSGSSSMQAAIREQCSKSVSARYTALATINCVSGEAYRYNGFMQDFSAGGWNALLDSRNSPINAAFNAADKLANSIATSQQNVRDERIAGQGFLDFKVKTDKCLQYSSRTDASGVFTSTGGVTGSRGLSGETNCLEWEQVTVTPGSVIAAQAATIGTSGMRQLEAADQINEVLGSFFDQFLNKLFSSGISGLSGGYGVGGGVELGGLTVEQATVANALGHQAALGGMGTIDFDISRPQQVRAILRTQKNFLNRTLDSQSVMDRIVPTLGALDYCIPGPNPDWQNGLDANFNSYINSFADATQGGTDNSGIGSSIGGSLAGAALSSAAVSAAIGTAVGATLGSVVPIIGTIIGSVLGGLVGKLFSNKPDTAYIVQPTYYDKTIGESGLISPLYYDIGFTQPPSDLFSGMRAAYQAMKKLIADRYSTETIVAMFSGASGGAATVPTLGTGRVCSIIDQGSYGECCVQSAANYPRCMSYCRQVGSNQPGQQQGVFDDTDIGAPGIDTSAGFDQQCNIAPPQREIFVTTTAANAVRAQATGFVLDALAETKKISSYNQGVITLDAQYEEQKTQTREAIAELESIHAEVTDLVSIAKARYVQEMAANGTPISAACLDKAYVIDRSAVVGDPFAEPTTIDPIVRQSNESKIYFYTHL